MPDFFHTTSEENLQKILDAGRLTSLKKLVAASPSAQISAEVSHLPWQRESLASEDALALMSGRKEVDKVFLTRGGYLPTYGEFAIKKVLESPSRRISLNSIPEEFTTKRALSIKSNAEILVPPDRVEEFSQRYPRLTFVPNTQAKRYTLMDRALNYPGKLRDAILTKVAQASSPVPLRGISRNAFLAGSEGLKINTDRSDFDVFIPYKSKNQFEKNIDRLLQKYPDLQVGEFSKDKTNKRVLSGKINGQDVDLVLAWGDPALRYADAFRNAKQSLSPERAAQIRETKQRLKDAWILPEFRYKRYKNQVAEELGLKQTYF